MVICTLRNIGSYGHLHLNLLSHWNFLRHCFPLVGIINVSIGTGRSTCRVNTELGFYIVHVCVLYLVHCLHTYIPHVEYHTCTSIELQFSNCSFAKIKSEKYAVFLVKGRSFTVVAMDANFGILPACLVTGCSVT